MRILLALAFLLAMPAASLAACDPPPVQETGGIRYFMDIQPSDGILDVWCRLQALQGDFRVNVWFPRKEVNAHRSFDVTFDGAYSHERIELATFIQSLLPTARTPAKDENGMNFSLALERAVQVGAAKTPANEPLGVPAQYAISKEIALWEPISLRIKPVVLAGVEFTVTVTFQPAIGRLFMALDGSAEDLVLKGWHEYVLREGGPAREHCPKYIPDCKELGDLVDMHTAWAVESVLIEAKGTGLSAAAMSILSEIENANEDWVRSGSMESFKPTVGEASIDATDGAREVRARADGDPQKAAGTLGIRILWNELPKSKLSYRWALSDYARQVREAMVLNSPTQ